MLGGYACQDTGDVQQAQRLAAVAGKGAAVVAAAHAAHAADPALLTECHGRLCTLAGQGQEQPPVIDAAACHAAMTSGIGVLVEDAGYHSQANLEAPGPDRLIADGKTRDLARRRPAEGSPPPCATATEANAHRLATPQRPRALQAPRPATSKACTPASKTTAACAAFSPPRPAQRHQRVPVRRPRAQRCGCWPPSAETAPVGPAALRGPATARRKQQRNPETAPEPAQHLARKARARPEPGIGADGAARLPAAGNCNSPYVAETGHDHETSLGRMEAPSPGGLAERAVGRT